MLQRPFAVQRACHSGEVHEETPPAFDATLVHCSARGGPYFADGRQTWQIEASASSPSSTYVRVVRCHVAPSELPRDVSPPRADAAFSQPLPGRLGCRTVASVASDARPARRRKPPKAWLPIMLCAPARTRLPTCCLLHRGAVAAGPCCVAFSSIVAPQAGQLPFRLVATLPTAAGQPTLQGVAFLASQR